MNEEQIRHIQIIPRSHGRNTQALIEFYTYCKQGKKTVFSTPFGNIYSPKMFKEVAMGCVGPAKPLPENIHPRLRGSNYALTRSKYESEYTKVVAHNKAREEFIKRIQEL